MSYRRCNIIVSLVAAGSLAAPAAALGQVCLGIPADEGQISLQGEVVSHGTDPTYGGRLAMNFDTEYSFDIALRRPYTDDGLGLDLSGMIGYEMEVYEPAVCFAFGLRYLRTPRPGGGVTTESLIPIALGIGKRLGKASRFSLALFVRPEYLVRVRPDPDGEFDTFWDELGARSEGRGVIGLLATTPLLFLTGSVEMSTQDYEPVIALGAGITF